MIRSAYGTKFPETNDAIRQSGDTAFSVHVKTSASIHSAFRTAFLELRHAMEYFQGFASHAQPKDMLDGLKPYMSQAEKEMMEQMSSMMNMMEMVRSMQSMSEGSPDSSSQGFGAFNPMDMMKGMLSPEQQEMFEMYNTMFEQEFDPENNQRNNPPDTGSKKGDAKNE